MDLNQLLKLQNTASTSETKSEKEFIPAQYWANIGFSATYTNADGEEESTFISLDKAGIPLDNIQEDTKNYKSDNMKMIQGGKNSLYAYLKDIMDKLEDGQAVTVPLQVEIRKVAPKSDSAPAQLENNPLDISKFLTK